MQVLHPCPCEAGFSNSFTFSPHDTLQGGCSQVYEEVHLEVGPDRALDRPPHMQPEPAYEESEERFRGRGMREFILNNLVQTGYHTRSRLRLRVTPWKKGLKAPGGESRQGGGWNPSCVEYPGRRAVSAGVAPRRRSICAGTSLEMDRPLRLRKALM